MARSTAPTPQLTKEGVSGYTVHLMRSLLPRLALLALVATLGVGCSKSIGDACNTNVDCSISGDRFCDTASVNGYCSVDGCDIDSCPGNSVCIRFYTPVRDQPCTYDVANSRSTCNEDQRCLCDNSPDGIACTVPAGQSVASGHCASENSERRWCMKRCGGDGDCRNDYECRETGSKGAEPVPAIDRPVGESAKFCVANGSML